MLKPDINALERDAILAGLRLLQRELESPDDGGWFGDDLKAVYTNDGAHKGLSTEGIDDLCERLNV